VTTAVVETSGRIRQLDKPADADSRVTSKDVADAEVLARLVQDLRKEVTALKRAWSPRRIDFDRITTTGTGVSPQTLRLPHGFAGRVRYWAVGWESPSSATLGIIERTDSQGTDSNTLVLYVYSTGVLSVRVEEAG
jgi:hypothetical protein